MRVSTQGRDSCDVGIVGAFQDPFAVCVPDRVA